MALCQHKVSEVRASFWTHVKDLVMSLLETELHDGRPGSVNAAMGWCVTSAHVLLHLCACS